MRIMDLVVPVLVVGMVGCGGGGQKGAASSSGGSQGGLIGITGTAAKGAPVASGVDVHAFCADGKSYQSKVKADGQFTLAIGSGALPCAIKTDGMFSISAPSERAGGIHTNVTPITNMIVIKHVGSGADSLFTSAGKDALLSFSQKTAGEAAVAFLNQAGYRLQSANAEFGKGFFDTPFVPNPKTSFHDFLIEKIEAAGGFGAEALEAFIAGDFESFPGGDKGTGGTGGGDTGGGTGGTGGGDTGGGTGGTGGGDTGGGTGDTGGGDTGGGTGGTGGGDTGGGTGGTGGGDTGGTGGTGGGDTGGGTGGTGGGDTGGGTGGTGGGDTGGGTGGTGGGDTGGGTGGTGGGDTGGGTGGTGDDTVQASVIALDSCSVEQKTKTNGSLGGVAINELSWLQTVQMNGLDSSVRLAGGKDAFLRVDLVGSSNNTPFPSSFFLGVHDDLTGKCQSLAVTGVPAGNIPTEVSPGVLTKSIFVKVPAALVKPNMSVLFVVSPNEAVKSDSASGLVFKSRIPVEKAVSDEIHLLKIVIDGKSGFYPAIAEFKTLFSRLFPMAETKLIEDGQFVPEVAKEIVKRPKDSNGRYVGTAQDVANLLSEVSAYCARTYPGMVSNASSAKCAGFWPTNVRFAGIGGLGEVGGRSMISGSVIEIDRDITVEDLKPYDRDGVSWLDPFAEVVAHEFGHVMGLNHANCGGAPGPFDERLYAGGGAGVNGGGYDAIKGYFFSQRHVAGPNEKVGVFDIMGYCSFSWMSDKGYQAVIDYKGADGAREASARMSKQARSGNRSYRIDLAGKRPLVTEIGFIPKEAAVGKKLKIEPLLKGLPVIRVLSTRNDLGVNPYGPFYVEIAGGQAGKLLDAILK